MNKDKYVFSQLVTFLDEFKFLRIVKKYEGNKYIKSYTCWNQLLTMMFGQLSNRESLRDLIVSPVSYTHLPQAPLWKGHLHIAMAPTKNMDRTEWFAEKATEIGFDELTFLNCRFSERKVIKTERISKILVSAIKQSLKARLPQLNEMTDFNKFITQPFPGQKFIAHCYEGEKPLLKDMVPVSYTHLRKRSPYVFVI